MRKTEAVFYAETYHPIQAGSIDGTDTLPHDSAVYHAWLCSSASRYDPSGDPNLIGDPYSTLFVARLSHLTTEHSLRQAMSKYGRVKSLRLVRHIVTGASRGYGFVEFETEREMRRAYKEAHHSVVDDYEIIVDYNRQQLMPGWIPRRLGGGFCGKKESGQLRFGGRERPFRAPIRIPYKDLEKLGIPPIPEDRYMSRHQDPSPPRRKRSSIDREEVTRRRSVDREEGTRRRSVGREDGTHERSVDTEVNRHKTNLEDKEGDGRSHKGLVDGDYHPSKRRSDESAQHYRSRSSRDRVEGTQTKSIGREESMPRSTGDKELSRERSIGPDDRSFERSSVETEEFHRSRRYVDKEKRSGKRGSRDRDERSNKRSSRDRDERSDKRSSKDRGERSRKRRKSRHHESSTSYDHS